MGLGLGLGLGVGVRGRYLGQLARVVRRVDDLVRVRVRVRG